MVFTPIPFELALGELREGDNEVIQYLTVQPIGLGLTLTAALRWRQNFGVLHGGQKTDFSSSEFFEPITAAVVRPSSPCCKGSITLAYSVIGVVAAACAVCSKSLNPHSYRVLAIDTHHGTTGGQEVIEAWLTDLMGTLEAVLEAPSLSRNLTRAAVSHIMFLNGIRGDFTGFQAISDRLSGFDWEPSGDIFPQACSSVCLASAPTGEKAWPDAFQIHHSPEMVQVQTSVKRYHAKRKIKRILTSCLSDFSLGLHAYQDHAAAHPRIVLFS